jgi:tetratricopeptide (TPR) repeat protein
VRAEAVPMKRRWLLPLALALGTALWCSPPALADNGVNIALPDAALSTISDPNDALRYARERIVAHDMQGAVVALQRYMMNHPGESGVERFLGDLYVCSGDLHDAEALYKQMISDAPLDRDIHNSLGRLYAVEGRTTDAITQFQESLPDVESIYYLVLLHQKNGDLDAFSARMRQAADEHPDDATAQLEAAQLFGALYLPRDSATYFQRALGVYPKSLDALEGLALAQTAENDQPDAQASLARCLGMDATNYGCLVALGMLDTEAGRNDDAANALNRAYALAPEEPEAIIGLARLAEASNDWPTALTWYERALYVWPYSADAYVGITYDDEEQGLVEQAETIALKGLSIVPDDGRLHYLLGYLYHGQGKRSLALAQFLAAEQSLDPDLVRFAKESVDELQHP